MEHISHPIGKRIRAMRKKCGMTQSQLAALIDKNPIYISYLETGTKTPSLETLIAIINALEVSADDILCDCINHHWQSAAKDEISELLATCSSEERAFLAQTIATIIKTMHSKNK